MQVTETQFKVGDKAVYPAQGVAEVVNIEEKNQILRKVYEHEELDVNEIIDTYQTFDALIDGDAPDPDVAGAGNRGVKAADRPLRNRASFHVVAVVYKNSTRVGASPVDPDKPIAIRNKAAPMQFFQGEFPGRDRHLQKFGISRAGDVRRTI